MTFFNDVKLLDPNKEIVVATEGALPSLDGSRLTNLSVTGGAVTILKTYTSPLSSISFPSDSGVVSASYSEMSLSIIIDSSLAAPFKTYIVKDGVTREAVMSTGYYNLDGVDVYEIGAEEIEGEQIVLQLLSVGGAADSLYPDRDPIAQIPVMDATLGICHYLDSTFTEISFAYPVWNLVEIRALVRSVNSLVTGTVIITPVVDDINRSPITINVGADWGEVTIPLAVETGSVRLVRTGGTLADGSWVTAAFRGITAMVTI